VLLNNGLDWISVTSSVYFLWYRWYASIKDVQASICFCLVSRFGCSLNIKWHVPTKDCLKLPMSKTGRFMVQEKWIGHQLKNVVIRTVQTLLLCVLDVKIEKKVSQWKISNAIFVKDQFDDEYGKVRPRWTDCKE